MEYLRERKAAERKATWLLESLQAFGFIRKSSYSLVSAGESHPLHTGPPLSPVSVMTSLTTNTGVS